MVKVVYPLKQGLKHDEDYDLKEYEKLC